MLLDTIQHIATTTLYKIENYISQNIDNIHNIKMGVYKDLNMHVHKYTYTVHNR